MRVIQVSTQVQMAADEFWALRLDQNYDDFCAQCDDVTFQLLSRRQEVCDGQTLEFIECLLLYNENPVPAAFQHMLGSQQFGFKYSAKWYRDLHDQKHPCTFVSEPLVMKDRISVRGQSWLVPISKQACEVCYHQEVNVRVFGMGSVVEQVVEQRMRESLAKLNHCAQMYQRTDAHRAFVARRAGPPGNPPRALPAPPPRPPPSTPPQPARPARPGEVEGTPPGLSGTSTAVRAAGGGVAPCGLRAAAAAGAVLARSAAAAGGGASSAAAACASASGSM